MEKYGTIPPRFTKEWWSHYWTYYKLHLFFALFIAFAIGQVIHSCVTEKNYDLKIQYAAYGAQPSAEALMALDNKIISLSSDVTGNGRVETNTDVTVTPPIGSSPDSMQYEYAVITKLIAQTEAGESQIYIVDKAFADKLISYQCLLPVTQWANEVPDNLHYKESLISLSENSLFKGFGFDTKNLYIGVLDLKESFREDNERVEKFENAVKVAKQLIKE